MFDSGDGRAREETRVRCVQACESATEILCASVRVHRSELSADRSDNTEALSSVASLRPCIDRRIATKQRTDLK